uniref:Methyltransferase HEMK2 n=1 Tax=Macrostomum lignano TaxID=282301 RepID=A0A1I8J9L8_9PLAT
LTLQKRTPDTNHAGKGDFTTVYPASEDSFLFLDCLDSQADYLRQKLKPSVSVEIGCGSGVISAHLVQHVLSDSSGVSGSSCACLCTDLNPAAALCTAVTCCQLMPVASDLAGCLRSGCADLVLANPPYVPTPDDEVGTSGIAAAWAGGIDGRQVIDRLLTEAERLLRPAPHLSAFYLLMLRENRPEEVALEMRCRGFKSMLVVERHCAGENLSVWRFERGGVEESEFRVF